MVCTPIPAETSTGTHPPSLQADHPKSTISKIINVEEDKKEHEITWLEKQRDRATYFQEHCQYERAGEYYDAILQSCSERFGDGALRTATAKEDVAVNLAYRGLYGRARILFEDVLKGRRACLNEKRLNAFTAGHHPGVNRDEYLAVADAYHNLAEVLSLQDLNSEANFYYLEALSIRSRHLESSDYTVLCTLAGLIKVYSSRGMLNQAKKLILKVRESYKWINFNRSEAVGTIHSNKALELLMLGVSQSEVTLHDLRGEFNYASKASP